MANATVPFDCRELGPVGGHGFPVPFTVKDTELIVAGVMIALDGGMEVLQASDTAGLMVLGRAEVAVDNTDDGETLVIRQGIFRYLNSAKKPLTKQDIGNPCFVEDSITVCQDADHDVAAGLVFDCESIDGCDYVWVDMMVCGIGLSGYRVGV